MKIAVLALTAALLLGLLFFKGEPRTSHGALSESIATMNENRAETVVLPESKWESLLTPERFRVMRAHGTEPAFRNPLHDNKKPGVYVAATTGVPLFTSLDKFDSGTGWPSFTKPVSDEAVGEQVDTSYGMRRTEVYARDCGSHLGHVFEDGPAPTGLRYCMNSAALEFVPAESEEAIPALVEDLREKAAARAKELTGAE